VTKGGPGTESTGGKSQIAHLSLRNRQHKGAGGSSLREIKRQGKEKKKKLKGTLYKKNRHYLPTISTGTDGRGTVCPGRLNK